MKTIAIITAIAAVAAVYLATTSGSSVTTLDAQFEEFITLYGKNYASESEINFRKEVFKANMKKAEELNALNPLAEFGMTIFSDQTESEMIRRMGAIDPKNTPADTPVWTQEGSANADYDWRGYMDPIQNQGSCGSCWAFSATATFEGRYRIKSGQLYKFSEQEALDCSSSQYGCNGGWYEAVWQMLKGNKFCTGSSYPYRAVKGGCQASTCSQKIANDSGYSMVATNESAMAGALASGPISIAVDASTWSSYRGGVVTRAQCGTGMNHAVVAVGLSNGAWIVRNSWGSGWGESGHIRLAYGQNTCNLVYKPAFPTF